MSGYIGKKVMELEIKKLGITVNDNSLRNIIKNDKLFLKMMNSLELNMKNF